MTTPTPLDLDAITSEWLTPCGACDAGIGLCTHPDKDYRPVMLALAQEIERLAYERDQYKQESERLGEIANRLVQRVTEERKRANKAARLSAEARDAADDLRTRIANQAETIADLECQRMDRDSWAVRVCTEHNLYELPLNVEDEFAAIDAALTAACRDLATEAEFADKAVRVREEALAEVEQLRAQVERWRVAADYRQGSRGLVCRYCSGGEHTHRMYCRYHVGPLIHSWVKVDANRTFGGTDYECSCGGWFRQGGLAGHGDGTENTEPICPDAGLTWRGPQPDGES